MHMPSLERLRESTILLPDHVGGRIRDYLAGEGFRVEVLPDRNGCRSAPACGSCCLADFNQDSALLVDIDGTLVIDANDCNERGLGPTRPARRAPQPTRVPARARAGTATPT